MPTQTATVEHVAYGALTAGDVLLGRHSGNTYEVVWTSRVHGTTLVDIHTADGGRYRLEAHNLCRVDRSALVHCDRCKGTGIYTWGGTVNGVPVHEGQCFRCGGKGKQDAADRKRNGNYDRYGIRL